MHRRDFSVPPWRFHWQAFWRRSRDWRQPTWQVKLRHQDAAFRVAYADRIDTDAGISGMSEQV
jgi:hypothetical protein